MGSCTDCTIAIRTRVRLNHLILLIPYWEGHRADPEEKRGPANDVNLQ